MRAHPRRRLLVFAVCALGVTALYLVPAPARTPPRDLTAGSAGRGSQPPAPVRVAPAAAAGVPAGRVPSRPAGRASVGPAAVRDLAVTRRTADELTLQWAAAPTGTVAAVSYRVRLDGFEVASTDLLSATVSWFNDDTAQHVVQVGAVDAAGRSGALSGGLLVVRPSAAPGHPRAAPPITSPAPLTPRTSPAGRAVITRPVPASAPQAPGDRS